jgi:polysaccharide export outer membrane protein
MTRRINTFSKDPRRRFAIVLLGALSLSGLSQQLGCFPLTERPLPRTETAASPAPPAHYILKVGDQIAVKFYQNDSLDEEVVIRPDGKISLQLVGAIVASGRSPEELGDEIELAYKGELATPRVAVIVRQLGSVVYVGGEVGTPKFVPYSEGLTLVQAVQVAAGFTVTAHLKQVILIRSDDTGIPKGYSIDVRPVLGGIDPGQDVPLQPRDIVFVPRSKIADVNLFIDQYIRKNIPIPIPLYLF